MNPERIAPVAVTLALLVGGAGILFTTTVVSGPGTAPEHAGATTAVTDGGLSSLLGIALWAVKLLFGATALVWAAFQEHDVSFALSDAVCRNQAPPSLYDVLQQRHRWAAGTLQAATMLPFRYEVLIRVRNNSWALSPIMTLFVVPLSFVSVTIVYGGLFFLASVGLALCTLGWFLLGVRYYGGEHVHWALALPLAPVITVIHSIGTLMGILDPRRPSG